MNKELKHPEFSGSEATVEFIRCFDSIFDAMNSKNSLAKGFKTPMKPRNIDAIKEHFDVQTKFISGIKTERGQRILKSPIKVGFLGMVLAMRALPIMYEELVTDGPLQELKTFAMSQDHIGRVIK